MVRDEYVDEKSRRKVLRAATGISGLSVASLFATGVGSAQTTRSGSEGYVINGDGYIEYNGDKDEEHIQEAVKGMNEAKRNGEVDFTIDDGQVVTQLRTVKL